MKKTIFYITSSIIAILVIWFVKSLFLPDTYQPGRWWEPFDRHLRKFDFANYALPEQYEMVTYRSGNNGDKYLLLYKDKVTGQLLTLVIFREHPKISLSEVEFQNGEVKRPFWKAIKHGIRGNFFAIWCYMPFGWRDDIENAGKDVTIKGIKTDPNSKNNFSTEKTDVIYIRGEFEKLGFYKKSNNWRPYVTPVLDFVGPRKGAIAIVNDKKTGKTLFAIGCNYGNAEFNEAEFRKIVESLDLDAIPLSEAFSDIKGLKKKTTVTRT